MYKKLSKEERYQIEILFEKEHLSMHKIANLMSRNVSTISRELARNKTNNYTYNAEHAQYLANKRTWHNHCMYLEKYNEFKNIFLKTYDNKVCGVKASCEKMKDINCKKVSYRQVYNWINSGRWVLRKKDKLRQYYKKGRKRTNGIFSKFKDKRVLPIWVRPKCVDLRKEFGHWELDLIIGKKSNGFYNILTFVERKSRILFMTKIQSKNPMKINSAIYQLIKSNNLFVKTITTDNGIEFEKIGLLANWVNCLIYYCEPYASYQKGSNEHINGIVRRFYKKGTDFTIISDSEIALVQNKINNMSREMFNWHSSQEIYNNEILKLNKKSSI